MNQPNLSNLSTALSDQERRDLSDQLDRTLSAAIKEDQIVWTVFGIFWAANAVLTVGLFTSGNYPEPGVGMVIASAGAGMSAMWYLIQARALGFLSFYEEIIADLEQDLNFANNRSISGHRNKVKFNKFVRGVRVRPLMTGSPIVIVVVWVVALGIFAYQIRCG